MFIVLVSSICVCPEFLSYITGLDVLDNIIYIYITDGLTCVQKGKFWVNDVGCW